MVKASTLLLSAGAAFVAACPSKLVERASCTFTDAISVIKYKSSCTNIVLNNIAVPAGRTLDLSGLNRGTTVTFQGTTSFGYANWVGPLIHVSGIDITVQGASKHVIDGGGSRWWDGQGTNSKNNIKPQTFYAHALTGESIIKGLYVKNTPAQAFGIDQSTGLTLDHITIDDSAGAALGHNTDGFDVARSSHITISNCHVINQDDCLAVSSGIDIKFIGNVCINGHGISVGSVGDSVVNVVEGVTVQDCIVQNSVNGVRIKTVAGKTGLVDGVTFDGITLSNIFKFGIIIEQDYLHGKPTGTPTNGVPIRNVILNNIHGNVLPSGANIYILCAKGGCSSWRSNLIKIQGGQLGVNCQNIPPESGLSC